MPKMPSDVVRLSRIKAAVDANNGDVTAAARLLGIDKQIVYRVLKSGEAAFINKTRFKLDEAFSRLDDHTTSGYKTKKDTKTKQTTPPLIDIAVQVSTLIADAVRQRAAAFDQTEPSK